MPDTTGNPYIRLIENCVPAMGCALRSRRGRSDMMLKTKAVVIDPGGIRLGTWRRRSKDVRPAPSCWSVKKECERTMMLKDKVAVITGAGSGVGRASARRFAEEGAMVVCADIDLDRAKETVAELEASGGQAVAERCDVANEADVAALIASAVGHFGRLDVMYNNVGIPTPRLGMIFEDHSLEDFERLTAVNFRGVFLGCRHAVLRFKEQGDGGVILNTGSVAGLVGWGGAVYGATKGAVHQLTRPWPSKSRHSESG